jgi:hypothetical protein
MGNASRRRKSLLQQHPYCIFCGGNVKATTIEHCPPRAMFQNRQWPEKFEFPCCSPCNSGTSNEDQIVAMISRFDPMYVDEGESVKYMTGVHNNNPGLLAKMMPSNVEARRSNRELGIRPGPGQTHQDIAGVKISPDVDAAIGKFAAKLSKGIFFLELSKVFPSRGCLALKMFTNFEIIRDGDPEVLDLLKGIAGSEPTLARSRSELNDQFRYKFCPGEANTIFALDVQIRFAFRLLLLGCTFPGKLESILSEDASRPGRSDNFVILQP